jgi:hypothetical protein
MVDQVLEAMRNFLVVAALASGGGSTGKEQCLIFQGENPRSDLNWLYGLVEGIVFESEDFL